MTPRTASGGRAVGTSFKGVFQYLQHDKRAEGQSHADSADRIAWQAFRNIATDDPAMAWRIMMATANQQDALKMAAGGSVAGNKSDKVVFHYSLAWHPDEAAGLSKAEMLRAADESLRALGASGHQAAIIAHKDTAHPHVHVVINRVNPENGKMLDIWNYQKKLSRWAMAYEQERGKIWCNNRVENWKRRDLGEVFSAQDSPYHTHKKAQGFEAAANDNSRDKEMKRILAEQKAKDADLAAYGAKMHARHRSEWQAFKRDEKDDRARLYARDPNAPATFKQANADAANRFKPLRSELGRKQWREAKAFEKNEKAILGKLENAIAAIRLSKTLAPEKLGGAPSSLFNFLTSQKHRRAAFENYHQSEWRDIGAAQRRQASVAIQKLKDDKKAALDAHRAKYTNRRQLLIDTQDAEKAGLSRQWLARHAERADVFAVAERMKQVKDEGLDSKKSEARSTSKRKTFNKVSKGKRRRKGRVRKRERV